MRRTWLVTATIILLAVLPAAAHGGAHGTGQQDQEQGPGMMEQCLDNDTCHATADMMGYDLFGMGSWGFLVGIMFWTLVIIGIFSLVKRLRRTQSGNHETHTDGKADANDRTGGDDTNE